MVIWSDNLDSIIPTCKDFEDRLIKLLWRSRPAAPPSLLSSTAPSARSYPTSVAGSISGHGHNGDGGALLSGGAGDRSSGASSVPGVGANSRPSSGVRHGTAASGLGLELASADLEKGRLGMAMGDDEDSDSELAADEKPEASRGRRWFGFGGRKLTEREKRRRDRIRDRMLVDERGVKMFAPVYNGVAAALSVCAWPFRELLWLSSDI